MLKICHLSAVVSAACLLDEVRTGKAVVYGAVYSRVCYFVIMAHIGCHVLVVIS